MTLCANFADLRTQILNAAEGRPILLTSPVWTSLVGSSPPAKAMSTESFDQDLRAEGRLQNLVREVLDDQNHHGATKLLSCTQYIDSAAIFASSYSVPGVPVDADPLSMHSKAIKFGIRYQLLSALALLSLSSQPHSASKKQIVIIIKSRSKTHQLRVSQ